MNDVLVPQAPSKLVPVLVGGAVMAATVQIPILQLINCACCAGIMGGAVLAVYMYKKNFPPERPFRVSDGVAVGALGGIVGAVLSGIISFLTLGLSSGSFLERFETQFENLPSGADPAQMEQARQFLTQIAESPGLFGVLMFVVMLLVFTAFGTLGGVIGGNIFKTKIVQSSPPAPLPG